MQKGDYCDMKRFFSIILAATLAISCVLALGGCAKNENASFDLVYITDGAVVDDNAYNESAWNGVKQFGDENSMSYRYYQPDTDENGEVTGENVNNYIKLAVDGGAQYIVVQGEVMAKAISEYAAEYPETKFLVVGAECEQPISNVMTVGFDTLQAGFLAGYTSVALGKTKLAYFGNTADKDSASYGIGYINGAAYAADESGIPTLVEYVNCDDENLDYSITIRPVYQKVEDSKEQTFKVNVVGGIGSGVYTNGENVTVTAEPAPEGKAFDHWETKSDTEGVKDKKVNISSDKKSSMNLLVGDCDCTITAVWRDADTVPVTVIGSEEVINAEKNSVAYIQAPAPKMGMVFDHWEADDESAIKDINSKSTEITVGESTIEVTPIYVKSEQPTYSVTVEQGTGTGVYCPGEKAQIIADAPQDGYMFYKWENVDAKGLSGGLAMDNEYCYITEFEMSDRYSSVVESLYDEGVQVVFAGGNSQNLSVYSATWSISHQVNAFGWGYDQNDLGNCLASVVCDYRVAVLNALADFKGATNYIGDCSNNCLYVTNISTSADDGNYNEGFAKTYTGLSDGSLTVSPSVNTASKCMTVKYWVK